MEMERGTMYELSEKQEMDVDIASDWASDLCLWRRNGNVVDRAIGACCDVKRACTGGNLLSLSPLQKIFDGCAGRDTKALPLLW